MKNSDVDDWVRVGEDKFCDPSNRLLPNLSSSNIRSLERAKKYALRVTDEMNLLKQKDEERKRLVEKNRIQTERDWALQSMCRLYISGINYKGKGEIIREAFLSFGPIKSFEMSRNSQKLDHNKGYAFIEYELPEAAELALIQMNNAVIDGRLIKVMNQINNVSREVQPIVDEIKNDAKNNHRIYIASIHPQVTEEDIRNVFNAYGRITFCKFVQDSDTKMHKQCGFIEYETKLSANKALAEMNLFNLGGKYLRVGLAITPLSAVKGFLQDEIAMPSSSVRAAAIATEKIKAINAATKFAAKQTLINSSELPSPGLVIPQLASQTVSVGPEHFAEKKQDLLSTHHENLQTELLNKDEPQSIENCQNLLIEKNTFPQDMHKLMQNRKSRVIILKTMVAPENVDDDLQEDIQVECRKYGELENSVIFKEKQSDSADADIIVKIFLQYKTADDGEKARSSLNRKYFGGRIVEACEYDQTLFDCGDYSA